MIRSEQLQNAGLLCRHREGRSLAHWTTNHPPLSEVPARLPCLTVN